MEMDEHVGADSKNYDVTKIPVTEQIPAPYQEILRDPEFEGLTLYEWWIFFLCGFGYLIDLMWAEAFGLIGTSLENELGFPSSFPPQVVGLGSGVTVRL